MKTELWSLAIVIGFGCLLGLLLARPTTRSLRSFLFAIGAGMLALLSLWLAPPANVALFVGVLLTTWFVALDHTEVLASTSIREARYGQFLSDAWDEIREIGGSLPRDRPAPSELRDRESKIMARIEARPAPDQDWDRIKRSSLELIALQLDVLNGKSDSTAPSEVDRRWRALVDQWRALMEARRRFLRVR